MQVVTEGKTDVVRVLLGYGADNSAKHFDGRALLQVAIDQGFDDIVEMLKRFEGS